MPIRTVAPYARRGHHPVGGRGTADGGGLPRAALMARTDSFCTLVKGRPSALVGQGSHIDPRSRAVRLFAAGWRWAFSADPTSVKRPNRRVPGDLYDDGWSFRDSPMRCSLAAWLTRTATAIDTHDSHGTRHVDHAGPAALDNLGLTGNTLTWTRDSAPNHHPDLGVGPMPRTPLIAPAPEAPGAHRACHCPGRRSPRRAVAIAASAAVVLWVAGVGVASSAGAIDETQLLYQATISVHGHFVRATPGSSQRTIDHPNGGGEVINGDAFQPLPLHGHLTVRPGQQITIHTAEPALSITLRALNANDQPRSGTVTATPIDQGRQRWTVRLPHRIGHDADRVSLDVNYHYQHAYTTFAAGIRIIHGPRTAHR